MISYYNKILQLCLYYNISMTQWKIDILSTRRVYIVLYEDIVYR